MEGEDIQCPYCPGVGIREDMQTHLWLHNNEDAVLIGRDWSNVTMEEWRSIVAEKERELEARR